MENSESSFDSLELPKSPRRDLSSQDFEELDWKRIYNYAKALDREKLFCSQATEPLNPGIVDLSSDCFAEGRWSQVFSARICGQWFACKRICTSSESNRKVYEKEINILQTLRNRPHWHVVQLLGFFPKPECSDERNLVLSPLAECTLADYLSQEPVTGHKRVVQRWFGCLAGGLLNIHEQNIKHKDIKPGNLLVHGDNIIITDLGISNKFSGRSTSYGDSLGTSTYMAPEVHKRNEQTRVHRGRQQDVWSLTCCFIEMLAFVLGIRIHDFRKSCARDNAFRFSFYGDYNGIIAWLNDLKTQTKEQSHLALIDLLLSSFKLDKTERPIASDLFARLREMPMFVGECCALPQSGQEPNYEMLSLSLSTNLPSLKPGSLSYFVASAGCRIQSRRNFPSARASMGELLGEVEQENVRSLRSAERKLMLYIAPVCPIKRRIVNNIADVICFQRQCNSAEEYLSFCNAFYEQLAEAVKSGEYPLYDRQAGEEEKPYTTAYFAVLVEVILSRCRTSAWLNDG
jgi:serine/threonine protein kinase